MTREEAAEVLMALKQRLEMSDDYDYCYYSRDINAYDTALAALSGWVRTADRVPTEADGDTNMVLCGWLVPSFNGNKPFYAYEIATKHAVCNNPEHHPLWHTLPPLPENAGAEGTKTNG